MADPNEPIDLDAKRLKRPSPLRVVDASTYADKPLRQRDWLVENFLLRRSISILNGDGGVGKSLLAMQLQVALATGQPWIGIPLPRDCAVSLGFYCEDDEDELHRRFHDICRHYGCTWSDLEGKVLFMSRVGENNDLMRFSFKSETGTRTALFDQVESAVRMHGVEVCIFDTLADIFMGNENVRPQVRAFVTMMRRLALINNGGVIMTAHPSRAGMADGSGLSGSTGWNGSVRGRAYLTKPKTNDADIDGEEGPTNDRLLKMMKSNYGIAGENLRLKWQEGVFVRTDMGTGGGLFDRLDDDRKLMEAAEYLIANGTYLSPDLTAKSALVNLARNLPSCKQMSAKAAWAAQARLIEGGRLVIVEARRDRKWSERIRPSHVRYAEERPLGDRADSALSPRYPRATPPEGGAL